MLKKFNVEYDARYLFLVGGDYRIEIPVSLFERKHDVLHGGSVKEWVDLSVDKVTEANLTIIAINIDREVKVRFSGERSYINFTLTTGQKEDLLNILNYYAWLQNQIKEH